MECLCSLRKSLRQCVAIALLALTPAAARESPRPIKLAVFDLELDDFSAGGPIAGESAVETARLQRMTTLVRDLLSRSDLFEVVGVNTSANPMVAEHWLRKCNGCDADAARDLGADMSFVGFFRKISVMEQYLELRIRDARTGQLVHVSQTDLRGETDESWSRALRFLIRYELVEPELRRREH
ncbi:hypothetical protein LMG27198_46730 [Methylocystis echinoides]|uniref:DUF2380 domain-containing protein n=1 Tax=Methylocystis echinoides TaxID=29468 RepID=A0A9W6GYY3_9HYPH|nr:hypothetical protein LMG27198_46730 [Methylocystis echinoides]